MKTRLTNGMTLVHTTERGTEVYVAKTVDKSNLLNGFKILVINKNNYSSDEMKIRRNEDVVKKTEELAAVADLTAEDAGIVAKYIINNEEEIKAINIYEKMNVREVFKVLYDAINKDSSAEKGYYKVNTNDFNNIIIGCGWNPLSFKKILLSSGMLNPGAGRIYDVQERVKDSKNKKEYFLKIKADALNEEAELFNKEVM